MTRATLVRLACGLCLLADLAIAASSGFPDPDPPQYDLTKTIDFERVGEYHLGPTGARGWMHLRNLMTHKARQILVTAVEDGSPADGVLQVGDVILGVGSKPFNGDARRLFGDAINLAEATNGKLKLIRWRPNPSGPRAGIEERVTIELPILGGYSETAPFSCQKSTRIYEAALAVLEKEDPKNMGRLKALAFLASGKPANVERVKTYLHKQSWASPTYVIDVDRGGKMTWSCGFSLLIMCEYYLLTGDDYVLPAITETAIKASMGQSRSGTYGHGFALPRNNGGKLHGDLVGYGALNLPSLHLMNGLLLAQRCGVAHPEVKQAIDRGLGFFRQFAGHGSISYGQHRPSFEHYAAGKNALGANGKNSLAALAFALAGDHDSARFFTKLAGSSFDTYEYGHGGNSFTVFWRTLGAQVGGPANAASFRRELRWYNALTRKPDGSFVIQPLGGFYGGETLNATAAQVLALSLPRKTLIITGRDNQARIPLSSREILAAREAGSWRNADYDQFATAELIQRLDSFSPSAREWLAKALADRDDVDIPVLARMLSSRDVNRRAGAATALGFQGAAAESAIPELMLHLDDEAAPVRVAAAYALARIGGDPGRILSGMFQAALDCRETSPVQPTMQALAYAIGYAQSYTAPLYFDGVLARTPAGQDPLADVDRDLLYAAVRKFSGNNNGRIRATGVEPIRYFNRRDLAHNAQLITDLIDDSPHGHVMFRDSARAVAISGLAKHRIVDGIDYAIDRLDFGHWGAVMRFPHRFETLADYGGLAKPQLAELKQLRWRVTGGDNRAALETAITAIDKAAESPRRMTLLALVEEQLRVELRHLTSRQNRAAVCRGLRLAFADDGYWQAAILKELAALEMLKPKDLLPVLGHRNPVARETALELAPYHLGRSGKRQILARLGSASPLELASVIQLLPALDRTDLVLPFLTHEDDRLRAAAVATLDLRQSAAALLEIVTAAPESATAMAALAILRRHPDCDLAAIEAARANADGQSQKALIALLGTCDEAAATDRLMDLLDHKDRQRREAARDALATRRDTGLDKRLLTILSETAPKKDPLRSQSATLLLQRWTVEALPPEHRQDVLAQLLAAKDVTTDRRLIGELIWLLPPNTAAEYLQHYLARTEKSDSDLAKRAARAIQEAG